MKKLEYKVTFVTPAFLGNASQDGQWRTPPFKALLRQWWRVVQAPRLQYDTDALRLAEGALFGVASDHQGDSRKSLIRIRLDRWDIGKEGKSSWGTQDLWPAKVTHPEVPKPIGPMLYLGYGPLETQKMQQPGKPPDFVTVLKRNAAIQAGEQASLRLAVPENAQDAIEQALALIHRYGTIGGRSRNGWGSCELAPADGDTPTLNRPTNPSCLRDWREALSLDWPHAIGRDSSSPLVWQTKETFPDWKSVMRRFAEIKIGLRTQFGFQSGNNATRPEPRHWLSYPVTKHSVADWRERGKGDYRLPNSLRFKVRVDGDGSSRGVVFHVPCRPPARFDPDLTAIERVWQHVHAFLDDPAQKLLRIPQ